MVQNTSCADHLPRPPRASVLQVPEQGKPKPELKPYWPFSAPAPLVHLIWAIPGGQTSKRIQTKVLKNRRSFLIKMNPKGISFMGEITQCLIAVIIRTYIFTLDSLGRPHGPAVEKLRTYLAMEARDKKTITEVPGLIYDKEASVRTNSPSSHILVDWSIKVPMQPNDCDCGVFLLHFVRIFMSDPMQYCQTILVRNLT